MKKYAAILLVICVTSALYSDGSKIGRLISFKELVAKTPFIFSAAILEVSHQFDERRAYGKNYRYVATYRFKAFIQSVYKGNSRLRNNLKKTQTVWLEGRSNSIPGKWVFIREKYPDAIPPVAIKKGDIILVFGNSSSPGKIFFSNCDSIKKVSLLKKELNLQ